MNRNLILLLAITTIVSVVGFSYKKEQTGFQKQFSRAALYKNRQIIQCSPNWDMLDIEGMANHIGVLPGWGNYRWNIATKNDSALFYFNQGINLYYAFHIIESMASFKKAEQFDHDNAMIYWAEALAYGPNINDFAYAATPEAFAAAQKARSLIHNCTAKEKGLIEAMAVRYTADSTLSRESLNQLYADAMKKAYNDFNADGDVSALYADALMLQHPWNYWKHNGEPMPWTPELIDVLESTLRKNPSHPGANHYYIHAVEASPNSARAMASANRLGTLMPGVAHMIHMPSHIYIRNGKYKEGIEVNEKSVKGYNNYVDLYPDVKNNAPLYLIHNLHMQANCAMMRANYAYSNKTAIECSQSFDTSFLSMPAPFGNFIQYIYMTPVFNNVRFGKWDEILTRPITKDQHIYARVLWHWARGMAFAGKSRLTEARTALNTMQLKMKHPDMAVAMEPFNAPLASATVAEKILEGVIAEQEGDFTKAISFFKEAVKNEDAMIYNEPKDWLLPAREYLGNALLKKGNAKEAIIILKEDLKENPNNHWSLYRLYQSYIKLHDIAKANNIKKQFDKAFQGADIKPGVLEF